MRKLQIIIPMAIAVVAVTAIGLSVAFAQENEKGDSNASRLATKVADILGLDATVVDDAIKQAREELRGEAVQKKLNALIEKDRLTQEQADEYLNWIQSRPEGTPAIGKHFLGKRGHHRRWKSHGGSYGSRNYFRIGSDKIFDKQEKASWEDIQKELTAGVEDGRITQEEAESKLKALQALKADKAESP